MTTYKAHWSATDEERLAELDRLASKFGQIADYMHREHRINLVSIDRDTAVLDTVTARYLPVSQGVEVTLTAPYRVKEYIRQPNETPSSKHWSSSDLLADKLIYRETLGTEEAARARAAEVVELVRGYIHAREERDSLHKRKLASQTPVLEGPASETL